MKVNVVIEEVRVIKRTYCVEGVNSLEMAAKCAERCLKRQFQPNTYMSREVPYPPNYEISSYEIVDPN